METLLLRDIGRQGRRILGRTCISRLQRCLTLNALIRSRCCMVCRCSIGHGVLIRHCLRVSSHCHSWGHCRNTRYRRILSSARVCNNTVHARIRILKWLLHAGGIQERLALHPRLSCLCNWYRSRSSCARCIAKRGGRRWFLRRRYRRVCYSSVRTWQRRRRRNRNHIQSKPCHLRWLLSNRGCRRQRLSLR